MKDVLWIKKAESGHNSNWIKFYVYADRYDKNKIYIVEYCGTEIDTYIPFSDEQKERLVRALQRNYGYAPFNIDRVKAFIGDGISIEF